MRKVEAGIIGLLAALVLIIFCCRVEAATCVEPTLNWKWLPAAGVDCDNDPNANCGSVFYWQDPPGCTYYAENSFDLNCMQNEGDWQIMQPTITSRSIVRVNGMWVFGAVYKSVIVQSDAPFQCVRLRLW